MNLTVLYFLKSIKNSKQLFKVQNFYPLIGLIISTAVLTVAFNVFDGYEDALKKSILSSNSHVYLFREGRSDLNSGDIQKIHDYLKDKKEIASFAPVVVTQAMLRMKGRVNSASIHGIPAGYAEQNTPYNNFIIEGESKISNEQEAVIGVKLAQLLNAEIGDEVTLLSPLKPTITPLGIKTPSQKLKIIGLYKSGMYEYDSHYLFVDMKTAQKFSANSDEITMVEVFLKNRYIDDAEDISRSWNYDLGHDYQIMSWQYYNGNLFSLLSLEKMILFIVLSFLILIASFQLISATSTMILEKQHDIGIMKAYGVKDFEIQKMFLLKQLLSSVFGIFLGILIGYGIGWLLIVQDIYHLKGDVYLIEDVSFSFSLLNASLIFVSALVIIFFSIILPLKRISAMNITNLLRRN